MATFYRSLYMIDNMPGCYTMRTDPNMKPVQHTWRNVLVELWSKIKEQLQKMANQGVITPETRLSLTYPQNPDGTLHICLDPWDLNKAIPLETYKPPIPWNNFPQIKQGKDLLKIKCKEWLLEHPFWWTQFTPHHSIAIKAGIEIP